jgi:hypothetical protein
VGAFLEDKMKVETVVIETKSGPVIINKSDFDEKKHIMAGAKKPPTKKDTKKAGK